jgi:NAD(P)-dependent dehydrogenase (short-subunit alcohol dehydrogenase family)
VDDEGGNATMKEAGDRGSYVSCDVGDLAAIEGFVNTAVERHGRIDALVNNAGITKSLGFFDVSEGDWDRINRVNNKGLFFCMQAVARVMREQRSGRIVNIASIAGKGYQRSSSPAYAASKGAVIATTYITAHQLAEYDITVNAVCPGVVLTPLLEGMLAERARQTNRTLEECKEQMSSEIPIGRANQPEDIAAMVVFLAGPGARNITGQTFNVDGGLIMH